MRMKHDSLMNAEDGEMALPGTGIVATSTGSGMVHPESASGEEESENHQLDL